MEQDLYYISREGVQDGPFSYEDILSLLNSEQLKWTDYFFDESIEDWIPFLQHRKFSDKMERTNISAPKKQNAHAQNAASQDASAVADDSREWYALQGDNRYGPFSYVEIVKMLQEKAISEHDYVWNESLVNWEKVATLPEFQPEKMQALQMAGVSDIKEVFFRRRHARTNYGASLIIHNNKKVYKGQSLEVSAGGAGLIVEGNPFSLGEILFLHFKPGDRMPSFNAQVEVVNVREIDRGRDQVLRYGVKFTEISEGIQDSIENISKEVA